MRMRVIFLILISIGIVYGSPPFFRIIDQGNDDGSNVELRWETGVISGLELWRDNELIATGLAEKDSYLDKGLETGKEYVYDLRRSGDKEILHSERIKPKAEYFNTDKITLLIFLVLVSGAIIYFILSAKSGKELYIRKISGLESIDEAVGRATEMGQPVLFVPGINDIDDMQTIAGLTILRKVAEKAAEYDTEMIVPVARSMVLSTAREVVRTAYMQAGRPDAYKEDSVFYLTDDQFGYVSGVDGIIVREKPAANFLLGSFYAESLILAETGFSSGAIQVAGTAMPSQLPFFVAACDYTLIGEELFAASAYLSRDPQQLGSLKGQDFGKALFVIILLIGVVLEMFNVHILKEFMSIH